MKHSQWSEALQVWFGGFLQRLIDFLPQLAGALALLLLGWLLARLARGLCRRLSRSMDWLLGSRTVESMMKRLGIDRPASEVVAGIVFWTIFLIFVTAATETVGLPVIATWIGGLSYYLPRVVAGLLIVFVGLLVGNLAGDAIQRGATAAGLAYAPFLGRATQVAILLIAMVTGVEQIGIDTEFLTASITIVGGALIGGAALAFGLGARVHVGNLIAAHYLQQIYRVDQTVRVADVQGRISEFLTTGVILETGEGRVLVPAEEFSQKVSILVTAEV